MTFYSTTQFPFPVPMSSLVDENEIDFIDLPAMLCKTDATFQPGKRSSHELKSILTLRKEHLVCWRAESSKTVFDQEDFAVIPVKPGDETLYIPPADDHVIYLFMEDFTWNPIDSYDGYKLFKDEGYLEISYKGMAKDFVPLLILCVDLSYRYGTKFMFWNMYERDNGDSLFLITLDKSCSCRNEILSDIEKNAKQLNKTYTKYLKNLKVYKDGPKFNVPVNPAPVVDDFE